MALISLENNKRLDNMAQRRRLLALYNPSPRVSSLGAQPRNRSPSRERGSGVSFAGTRQKPNYTSPSSVDDGGNENDRELDKKDNEAVKVILSGHRDLVINLGQKLFYSNTLLIVTSYDEAYAKINLTIRNHFNG
jgi:hypothetical protein